MRESMKVSWWGASVVLTLGFGLVSVAAVRQGSESWEYGVYRVTYRPGEEEYSRFRWENWEVEWESNTWSGLLRQIVRDSSPKGHMTDYRGHVAILTALGSQGWELVGLAGTEFVGIGASRTPKQLEFYLKRRKR